MTTFHLSSLDEGSFALVVIARSQRRRSTPESLDLPLRGTNAWEYYHGHATSWLAM